MDQQHTAEPTTHPIGGIVSRRALLAASAAATGAAVLPTLPTATANAAPPVNSLPSWPDPVVLFEDDAASMSAAGWKPRAVAAGAYAVDAVGSAANPYDIDLPAVPAGEYLLYADEVAQPAGSYATMTRPLTIGAGAWQLELRLRIDDIPLVHEYAYSRGLTIVVAAGGQKFTFALVNRDDLQIAYTSTNSHRRQVPVPFDGAFHDWTFRYDGVDTTMVAIDSAVVAVVRDVNVKASGAEGLTINALALNWKSGKVKVHIDRVRVTARRTTTALGPGASLTAAGWEVGAATTDAFLTDNARSTGTVAGMPAVPSGECLLFSRDRVSGRHNATLGSGPWTWRFLAKGSSLPQGDELGNRGVFFGVDAGGRRLEVSLVSGKVGLRRADGTWLAATIGGTTDAKFHQWAIARDDRGRHLVERDGQVVLLTEDEVTTPTTETDGVTITGDGRGSADPVEIAFSGFVLGRDTSTAFHQPSIDAVSVLPDSDATQMRVVVGVTGVDPVDLAAGSLVLSATLVRNGDPAAPPVAQREQPVRERFGLVSLPAGGRVDDLRLDLAVRRGAEIVTTASQRWLAPIRVIEAAAGASADPAAGEAVLFDQVEQCATADGTTAAAAGWTLGTYAADGADLAGVFLDSSSTAQPLVVPVALAGECTVRVGFLSGTEAFDVRIGEVTRRIELPGVPEYNPETGFGPRVVGEVEVFTGDGAGRRITIAPVADKQVRLTHLRVTGLSSDEATLAGQPAEGASGRRAMYNNDGYSDFFAGRYNSVADLRTNAVDVYRDSDVGAMTWQAGTTFMLTYDSQWAGRPYASLTPAQEALMRDGDKVAMTAILDLLDNGLVPLEIITARAAEIGIAAYAGLRMDTFYSMAAYPWYNGNIWDEYQDSLLTSYTGTRSATRMTYTSTKFATYIRNVLVELAGFDGVTGLDLDFSRYPDVVGWEPDTMAAYQTKYGVDPRREVTPEGSLRWQQFRADLVTAVFRQLRAAVPDTEVIVRVPQANTLAYGLDVATWVSEGLVDVLVPTNISHEQFWTNLDDFTAVVSGTDVKLYGGVTHTLAGNDLTKSEQDLAERGYASAVVRTSMSSEMYAERASVFYDAGYDGVYVFNNWRAVASLGLVGDKVVNQQWRTFSLPPTWTHLGATAKRTTATTTSDLLALLDELLTAGDLSRGQFERFRATVDQAARAAAAHRTELARSTLERLVTQVRENGIAQSPAAQLIAAVSTVGAAW